MVMWTPGPGATDGDDTFVGDLANDIVDGLAGNDTLSGGDGDDVLNGGEGNDTLILDVAGDTDGLFGDAGDDLVIVDDYEPGIANIDGGDGYDTLWLQRSSLAAGSSVTGFERLVITSYQYLLPLNALVGITTLYAYGSFDMNTPGTVDLRGIYIPEEFTFDGVTYQTWLTIRGSAGNDAIVLPEDLVSPTVGVFAASAGDGDDIVTGGDNNEFLSGDAGDDIVNGGGGNDSLAPGSAGANGDIVNGGAGDDLFWIEGQNKAAIDGGEGADMILLKGTLLPGSTITNVETILIDNGAIDPNGLNGIQTVLFARYQAFLSLSAPGVLDFRGKTIPLTYDITMAGTRYYHDDPVVTFYGTDDNDSLLFDPTSPVRLFFADGGAGDDHLMGGYRDDQLLGGQGNNILEGQGGNDTLRHHTDGHDTSYGGSGDGQQGDDTYHVDNAADVAFEAQAGWGVDTVYTAVNYELGANLEHLVLTGAALNGRGNAGDNTITGNANANRLNGQLGNDTIIGGVGNDVLIGGGGDDDFVFALGDGDDTINDFIAGGAEDSIDLSAYDGSGVTWTVDQAGQHTVFNFSNGDSITLLYVNNANLVQDGLFGYS